MSQKHRLELAGAIVLIEIVIDQATKAWAKSSLESGRVVSIVPTVELDLAFNSGFSFGTGAGQGRLIGLLVVVVAAVLVRQILKEPDTTRALLMAVIVGGAIGNLFDRVFRAGDGFMSGRVIDFIDVTWYAVFNLADSFVVLGVIALAIDQVLRDKHSHRK